MANDINKWIGIGRLTKDAELKYTQSGKSVMKCDIAVGGFKDAAGNQKTSFFRVVSWGKLGESISKYLLKGNQIAVEGHLEQNVYENKEGKKVYEIQIIADKIEMLGGKKQGEAGQQEGESIPDNPDEMFIDPNF